MNKSDKTTASDSDAPLWYGITKFERATSAEVERHIPIVRKMIELYGYGDALSYDEKFAAGLVGVAIAIERFDASRGVKYAYWLSYQIDKAIRNESRLVRRQRRRAVQPFDEDFDPIDERDWEERATRDDREERTNESYRARSPRENSTRGRTGRTSRTNRVCSKETSTSRRRRREPPERRAVKTTI